MTLVDTSMWVGALRVGGALDLDRWVPFDEIVTCLPVIQEVLQGFRREDEYRYGLRALGALPIVESPVEKSLFLEAVDLYRRVRRVGLTVRSSLDCLIAACALRHDLVVLHDDRDYGALARVSQLRERNVREM